MPLIQNDAEKDYVRHINLAMNFINDNLDSKLSLETISKAALYSWIQVIKTKAVHQI